LADKDLFELKTEVKSQDGVKVNYHPTDKSRPPYVSMVPLAEIISEAVGVGVNSKKVTGEYENLISRFGSEFDILLKSNVQDIKAVADERVGEGIEKVRSQDIVVNPGYDGEFGVVKIWKEGEEEVQESEQIGLF